jgi:hypothetical protein
VRYPHLFSILSLPLALSVASCSGDDSKPGTTTGGGNCAHFNYATYMASATPVPFDTQVVPLMNLTCALGVACHSMGSSHPPALGGTGSTPASIKAAIVGINSTEVASMKYVVAGDPQNSYLMRKIEEENPGCGLMCTPPAASPMGCSTRMPSLAPALTAAEQTTFRDWIKQGAL